MKNIEVFCDGGSRGNPGPAAIGFLITDGKKIIYRHSEFIGKATNNVAEYTAVLRALEWLVKKATSYPRQRAGRQLPATSYQFFLDSQLVVQQLSGLYKIKNLKLKSLAVEIKSLERKLAGKIFYRKVSRQQNKLADGLVNLALNKKLFN